MDTVCVHDHKSCCHGRRQVEMWQEFFRDGTYAPWHAPLYIDALLLVPILEDLLDLRALASHPLVGDRRFHGPPNVFVPAPRLDPAACRLAFRAAGTPDVGGAGRNR